MKLPSVPVAVRSIAPLVVALVALLSGGCGDGGLDSALKLGTHEGRIAKLEERSAEPTDTAEKLEKLSERFEIAREMIDDLSTRLVELEALQRSATFDPAADPNYQIVRTNVMPLAFVVQKVTPNADGVRVQLQIGNTSNAIASGGSISIKWGPRSPDFNSKTYFAEWLQWDQSLRSKDIEIIQPLHAGRWNNLEVSLPKTDPKDLGHIEITAEVREITLMKPLN
jgi:hypothetical protein